jgi:hypothetical protein
MRYVFGCTLCDMQNEASKTRTLNIAFVVTPDLLKRLAGILGETSDSLEYTVKFYDGTSVHYAKIEDIIGQPNSGGWSIVSLIAGTANNTAKAAYVNLKKDDFPSLEYTINGTQRDVVYFADQLDGWVTDVRQWYSLCISNPSTSDFSGAFMLLLLVALAVPLIAWEHISGLYSALGKGHPYSWVAIPALTAMWTAEYWILKLFPRGTFAIGQGERRHQFFIYMRRTVLTGVALSALLRGLWMLFTGHA